MNVAQVNKFFILKIYKRTYIEFNLDRFLYHNCPSPHFLDSRFRGNDKGEGNRIPSRRSGLRSHRLSGTEKQKRNEINKNRSYLHKR